VYLNRINTSNIFKNITRIHLNLEKFVRIPIALLCISILFVLFKFASLTPINSDAVQNILEVTSILHGNIILHGWYLTSDNFYVSDNPFFFIGRLIWGKSETGIYGPPFLIYIFLITAMILIIRSYSRELISQAIGFGAVLFYIATPGMGSLAPIVFVGAQHIAVLGFCLYGWLTLERIQTQSRKSQLLRLAVVYAACTFIVFFSDPMGTMMFLPPTLIGLYFAFLSSYRSRLQIGMGGLTLAVFLTAHLALLMIHAAGGFSIVPSFNLNFVSAADFGENIEGELFGLLHLAGAYFFGRPAQNIGTLVSVIRLVGLGIMSAVITTALRRGFRGNEGWNLRFVLSIAILVDLASSGVSADFTGALVPSVLDGGAAVRYLTPTILFGGLLVALELPTLLKRVQNRKALIGYISLCVGGVIATTSVFLIHGVQRWPEKPAVARSSATAVGNWLFQHGLTRGVAPYWNASIITALSGQRVVVRAVIDQNDHLEPFNWLSNAHWYSIKNPPQFVIYAKNNQFGVTARTIKETYGSPSEILMQDGYAIAIFGQPSP
jgi:hypothetical protein